MINANGDQMVLGFKQHIGKSIKDGNLSPDFGWCWQCWDNYKGQAGSNIFDCFCHKELYAFIPLIRALNCH